MNKQSLLVLLPVLALGACAQPETTADSASAADVAVAKAEAAVSQTVVLSISGAS